MLIYPAIDLKDGCCVRLMHGRFDQVTVYDDDPFARLAAFAAAGTEWTHIVDLDGAKNGAPAQHGLIGRLASSTSVRIQAGGGVRARAHVEALLDAGARRVVVGSAAVERPEEVRAWIAEFGVERVCLALDVRPSATHGWEIAVRGWTEGAGLALADALSLYPAGAARHVLITDVSRDGALVGPNIELMREVTTLRPDLQVQASGGVSALADLAAARDAGAAGVIVGRALYEAKFTLAEALDAG